MRTIRLVVDTNVLLTFYWRNSVSRQLITRKDFALVSPEYALTEIMRHKKEVMEKAHVSALDFRQVTEELATYVNFVPLKEYEDCLREACDIPDEDDADFIALAIKNRSPLWSNDAALKRQEKTAVLTTAEIIKLLTAG
jgi:predicted nucleic acid-binding protein